MSRLDEILTYKRAELETRMAETPLAQLRRQAEDSPLPPDFMAALQRPPQGAPRLIAEIKCASPSRGVLAHQFQPLQLARTYAANGAAAISVLTDEHFFRGGLHILRDVAALGLPTPLLRKDFILEEYQLYEARAAGASAALLIVAALEPQRLRALHALAADLGLAALVEAHNQAELEQALDLGAALVGINNRDLGTFTVSLETTVLLRPLVPAGVTVVAESGIFTTGDVERLAAVGVDAILVGEALVTAPDVAARVAELSGHVPEAGR
ncbi:MAG: indole-3-glycerol phosphate synthase TrpC [Anaerolineaceae bacterium]|nr:indole-3-glycerol phosphate synthase TrpC [Anaerolineaceae bacterium]